MSPTDGRLSTFSVKYMPLSIGTGRVTVDVIAYSLYREAVAPRLYLPPRYEQLGNREPSLEGNSTRRHTFGFGVTFCAAMPLCGNNDSRELNIAAVLKCRAVTHAI